MELYEGKLKVFLLQDIPVDDVLPSITDLFNESFLKDTRMKRMHRSKEYVPYCFSGFYPIERKGVYQAGNIYTVTFRTLSSEFLDFAKRVLKDAMNEKMKALLVEVKNVKLHPLQKVYALTPIIFKVYEKDGHSGYPRSFISLEEYEGMLQNNLIEKYKFFFRENIPVDELLYTTISFKSQKPIAFKEKGITLLGDKLELEVSANPEAQKVMQLALATGVGHNNSRGAGFMNYQFLKRR